MRIVAMEVGPQSVRVAVEGCEFEFVAHVGYCDLLGRFPATHVEFSPEQLEALAAALHGLAAKSRRLAAAAPAGHEPRATGDGL